MLDTLDPPPAERGPSDGTGDIPAAHLVERAADERVNWPKSIPFLAIHLTPLLVIFTGVTLEAVIIALVLFWTRMFFITAGYHRYFSHKSYKMSRVPQFLMAFGGTTAAQKGPLWWAGHHRDHHSFSDTERDVHSPMKGFWWSHVGWILCDKYGDTPYHRIRDFERYPELRFLNRFDFIGPWLVAIATFLIAGWPGLVIGFFCSTIVLWHATFTVNSLAHVMGRRRYVTDDTSRNSVLIALLTLGEGWHNNHHYYQASVRQGFFWWELDPSYYVLKAASWVGLVKDLKVPPERVLRSNRVADGNFDIGMFKSHWSKAARAVAGSQAAIGEKLHDGRESLDGAITQRREDLEVFVESARESAEDLARATRRGQRELGLAD